MENSGTACTAGMADTAALRARVSDKIVTFMLFVLQMFVLELCGIRRLPINQEVEWRLMIAGAGNECGRRKNECECGEGEIWGWRYRGS